MRTATKEDLERAAQLRRAVETIQSESGPSGLPATRLGSKVLLSAVWRALDDDGDVLEWRRWLLRGMLTADDTGRPLVVLARIDVTGAVDPNALRRSAFADRGATFHAAVDIRLEPGAYAAK